MLTKEEYNILNRIIEYEGKDFDKCRLTNPCITKRESIFLANAIFKICPDVFNIIHEHTEVKNGFKFYKEKK